MRKRVLILVSFLLLSALSIHSVPKTRVAIKVPSCQFSVEIPEGWDTIPQNKKPKNLGNLSLLGLYPKEQKEFIKGKYVFISFMPTAESLNNTYFTNIVSNLEKMNESSSLSNDSMHVLIDKMKSNQQNGTYQISTAMTISKDTTTIKCLQCLLLTKFGYIGIMSYDDNIISGKPEIITRTVINSIDIQEDYKYTEPENKSAFTPDKIAIALGIGVLVFIIMTLIDKRK